MKREILYFADHGDAELVVLGARAERDLTDLDEGEEGEEGGRVPACLEEGEEAASILERWWRRFRLPVEVAAALQDLEDEK